MGIKGINAFLKGKIDCFKECDIDMFAGKTIAIDGGFFFMKIAANVNKGMINSLKNATDNYDGREFFNKLMTEALGSILFLVQNRINIIMVFEGKMDPYKIECVEKRREIRNARKEQIEIAKEEYNLSFENPLDYDLPDDFEKKLKKLRANDFHLEKAIIPEIQETLKNLGIPVFTAPNDAEAFCCSLVNEGKAFTIYTNDTDCYAFGINHIITRINRRERKFEITDIRMIYNFIQEQFKVDRNEAKSILRDLCIFCGCDFNRGIPGIGPAKSFKLLKTYGSISNCKIDTSPLNYDVCLTKFSCFETLADETLIDLGKMVTNIDGIIEMYNSRELEFQSRTIKSMLK